jgi:hypothetical protein
MNYNIEDSEWKEFREKHKECELTATIGGKFSFIFTPTGLGPIVEVRCNKCGKQEDITNYDVW